MSIIKSFSHKEKVFSVDGIINAAQFVYVLRHKSETTESIPIGDYGSLDGYFREDIEQLLSEEYETPLGETKKKIIDLAKRKVNSVDITKEDFLSLKNYFKVLLYRNQYFFHIYLRKSIFASHEIADQPSDYVGTCHELNVDPILDFDLYSLTIAVATGKRQFINNYSGLSYIEGASDLSDNIVFFVPLSPLCGVVFFIPKSNKKEDKYLNLQFADDEATLRINKFISITETILTKNSLISKNKGELVEIMSIFNGR